MKSVKTPSVVVMLNVVNQHVPTKNSPEPITTCLHPWVVAVVLHLLPRPPFPEKHAFYKPHDSGTNF